MEKRRRINVGRLIKSLFMIGLVVLICFMLASGNPHKLVLNTGWQKIEAANVIVPKGSIMVVAESSNLVIPGDGDINQQQGYITQGMVVFYQDKQCITKGSVWVYCPEKYEFLTKATDLAIQCDSKLADLTGNKESKIKSIYFVGRP